MLRKYSKVLSVICAATVVMTTAVPVHASAFPSAGASPALEATSVKDQEATVAATTPVVMSVGGVSADKFTSIHSDVVQEVESEANTVIEDTVLVEETPEETTVSMNDIDMEYANLVIAKVNDYVNVRSDASEEAEIVGKLYDKSVGTYLSEKDGWYEIASGNCRGYVKAEYVVTGTDAIALAKEVGKRIATVTTTTLYVREMPSTESSVIGMVPIEDELTVVEEGVDEGWIKVSIEEGEGYVSSEFVTLSTEFVKAESKAEEEARLAAEEAARKKANAAAAKSAGGKSSGSSASVSGGSGTGSAVASYALQFVGNPYVYGGSSLTNGTDCSGFVMSVYAHFGVGLPHSSGAQRGCGYDVGGLGNAQPGDIVCYSGHVGIYIGGGQIVHASTAATGIKVSNAGYRQVLSVRRIF
ncbi:MAG: SH3 domain-containing protein [Lachnospiraceae bacterium]|nr:SH3 domain-containing protein [Lachnospiraceae bacterium]